MIFEEYGIEIRNMENKAKGFSSEFLNSYDSIITEVKDVILDETNINSKMVSKLESIENIFKQEMSKLVDYFVDLRIAYNEILNQQNEEE